MCRPGGSLFPRALTLGCCLLLWLSAVAAAGPAGHDHGSPPGPSDRPLESLADRGLAWPDAEQLVRVLSLRDHNTRVVVAGTAVLGVACGLVGGFLLLRKRALLGDAVSHATLPGIGIAFIIGSIIGEGQKSLPLLLAGAAVAGVIGGGCVLLLRHHTRLKEDAALAIVLSVFFGAGVAIMGLIQNMRTGHAAGLETFIYGQTASMLARDAWIIGGSAAVAVAACGLFFKELTLLTFDQDFAASEGVPVRWLDAGLMALAVGVTVVGLQAVGLILIIAMLIIPPAAARFWCNRLSRMLLAGAAIGGVSGLVGASLSALVPRLPAGAIIVVVAAIAFAVSFVFGRARGVVPRWYRRLRLDRRVARQNLLRVFYEVCEDRLAETDGPRRVAERCALAFSTLLGARSWSVMKLRRGLRRARREGLVRPAPGGHWSLTEQGAAEAARVVRNHRLWEVFLITEADVAPSHVDRDADAVEHVLGADLVKKLERELAAGRHAGVDVPPSPHLGPANAAEP